MFFCQRQVRIFSKLASTENLLHRLWAFIHWETAIDIITIIPILVASKDMSDYINLNFLRVLLVGPVADRFRDRWPLSMIHQFSV